jgi:hypothetical protein
MVKEEIEEKIAQLSNLDHKKRIAKVFKDLWLDVSITKK